MPELTKVEFNQELALDLFESEEQFPVDFDDAWIWLGYSRRDNAKTKFSKCGFIEGVDYVFLKVQENLEGRPRETFKLTTECFKVWGMMAGTEKGREIRLYFLNCERIAKTAIQENRRMQRLIDLPRDAVHRLNLAVAKRVRSSGYEIKIKRSRFSGGRVNFYPAYHPLVINAVRDFRKK